MDKSIWIDSIDDIEIEHKSLEENIETDICIVGGGLTGLSTAYYLSKEGRKVTILEKYKICNHVSGNTTAKITSQHDLFYKYLIDSMGIEKAKKYLDANEEAIKNIEEIINNEEIECDFEKQDAYIFTQSNQDVEKILEEVKAVSLLGKECEYLEEIPISNILKKMNNVKAAIKFKNQAQFNSCKYAMGLKNAIIENKGEIYENSKVLDIKKGDNKKYNVITEKGIVKADKVVLACHYPIINFPRILFYENVSRNIIFNCTRNKRRAF